MKIKILTLSALLVAGLAISALAANGEWSPYPACDKQYDQDVASCKGWNTTAKNKEGCYQSASQRLAACGKSKGATVNSPILFKG